MDGAKVRLAIGEVPTAAGKHPRIGPRGNHFANEQVMRLLIVRLRQQPALQPGHAARQQGCRDMRCRKSLEPKAGKFVALANFAPADRSHIKRGPGLRPTRHIQGKFPRGLNQFTRPGVTVNHHHDFGRIEIESAIPCCRHDVAPAAVGAADQHRRSMVQQAIGFG